MEERVIGTEQEERLEKTDSQSGISHPNPGVFLGGAKVEMVDPQWTGVTVRDSGITGETTGI